MQKIGVVTLYGNNNIGNKLQTYAVKRLYQSLGYDVTIVNHIDGELYPNLTLTVWVKLRIMALLSRICPVIHPKSRRRRLFTDFADNYLTPSEKVSILRVPSDLKERYDFFSVGSDQVWHNWSGTTKELDFFFLKFADKRQRLCLSPSFGLESIPESEKETYRNGLNGFPRLSCREASGVELIRALTGREATLLLDPTMGLSAEDWTRLERKPPYPLPERYVLSFMLDMTEETQLKSMNAVSRYAHLLGADVVNINDRLNLTERYVATGPQEFLYLIRHALFICTNSFHGTVFSILFHRNFVCFDREDVSAWGEMSNRIDTLLDKFHLTSRRYGVLRDEDLLSADYTGAEETLSLERKRILDYMQETLADNSES